MAHKITIIGAGSAVFSLNMIRDICLTPNLQGSIICFLDIDEQRLNAAHRLCTRYASEIGVELQLEKTTDRSKALQNADIVINAALAAGHDHLREGWEVAKKYGYRFGGSLHIMHDEPFWINFYQLQLFEAIIEDVLSICPSAWYVQVANPVMGGITHLARKYPQARIVGLCHGYAEIYEIARILGLNEREHLTFEIPGVNHFVWLTQAYYKGEPIFPLLDEWIATKAPDYWRQHPWGSLLPKQINLYQRFGLLPIGDTGTDGGGSWGWWYHTDTETEQRWLQNPVQWWQNYFTYTRDEVATIQRVSADTTTRVTQHYSPSHSDETIIPLVESLLCDIPRVLIGNIQNTGTFVQSVPQDFAVEIPTLVSKRGIQGIQTTPLTTVLQSYMQRDYVAPWNLELSAYNMHSKQLLLELILMDPWTTSERQAQGLLETIFALPYHEKLREYYQ